MAHTFERNADTAQVKTAGGRVQGYRHDGLYIFKGIPYAAAERFHAPQPVKPWEGVLDACSYGFVCPPDDQRCPEGRTVCAAPLLADE